MNRGVVALIGLIAVLLFAVSSFAQYPVESLGIPGTSDYVDYDSSDSYDSSGYDYSNGLTGGVAGIDTITGMQTVTRASQGQTQARSPPSGECTSTHIEKIAAKIDAKKRTLDLLEADLTVQIKNFKGVVVKMQKMQLAMGAQWKTCSTCPGYLAGNVTINEKNYTNVTVACEKCTTTTLMRQITQIKAQFIEVKATIVKIKAEIKRIHAEITQIKIDLKGLSADLFECKFKCPPCPPGTVAAPVTGVYGISCSGGVVTAFAATLDIQIGHIEAFLAKLDIEFKKIDITIDTIDILIDEIKKTEVTCTNCVFEGEEFIEEARPGIGTDKSQLEVARELQLTSETKMNVVSSEKTNVNGQAVWHTRLQNSDLEIVVQTTGPFPGKGDLTLDVTGGGQLSVTLHVSKPTAWAWLRFLGFGLDTTLDAKIVSAKLGEKVVIEQATEARTQKRVADLGSCGGCSTKNLWALFLKITNTHQKLTVAMLKVQGKISTAHVDFVKVSANFKTQSAKFMKCSFNCPKCIRLQAPPEDAYRVGDDYPQTRTRPMTGTTAPQDAISVGGTGTTGGSCEDICGAKGMVTKMPDHSSYILNYLNSHGVCKKSASVRFGSYLRSGSCTCYPTAPPSISVSGEITCNSPCGVLACNSQTECSCGENCIMTARCKWGGWRQVGAQSYQPVVSTSS